jgi:hypothetical protein
MSLEEEVAIIIDYLIDSETIQTEYMTRASDRLAATA